MVRIAPLGSPTLLLRNQFGVQVTQTTTSVEVEWVLVDCPLSLADAQLSPVSGSTQARRASSTQEIRRG